MVGKAAIADTTGLYVWLLETADGEWLGASKYLAESIEVISTVHHICQPRGASTGYFRHFFSRKRSRCVVVSVTCWTVSEVSV
jgi:hypothetical protein